MDWLVSRVIRIGLLSVKTPSTNVFDLAKPASTRHHHCIEIFLRLNFESIEDGDLLLRIHGVTLLCILALIADLEKDDGGQFKWLFVNCSKVLTSHSKAKRQIIIFHSSMYLQIAFSLLISTNIGFYLYTQIVNISFRIVGLGCWVFPAPPAIQLYHLRKWSELDNTPKWKYSLYALHV